MNDILRQSTLVQRLEYALQVAKEDGNCHILRVNLAYLSSRINNDYEEEKKEKMNLVKKLEHIYKATGAGDNILENELRVLGVETNLAVDYVFFVESNTNKVLYGFEL